MSLRQLKWLTIVAPAAFLFVVMYLLRGPAHEELHHFPGYLYVLAVLTVAVGMFSFFIFGILARVERRILEQNDELQQRNRELGALLAVGQATNSSVSLEDALDAALDVILPLTGADAAEVWLADEDGGLTRARERGVDPEPGQSTVHLRRGEGLPGLAASSGSRELPLVRKGGTVGVLVLAGHDCEALDGDSERRLLTGIGEMLAAEIENAYLHERVLDTAVIEEREHLARELHDGLAQVLGYVNTQTLAIKKLLATGRTVEAREHLAGMEGAARDVYADVRGAILGLRAPRRGLVAGLRRCCSDHERLSGTAVELEVGADVAGTTLTAPVEIQVTRIVQEALINVRKHAPGAVPTVKLAVDGNELEVEIEDHGPGFEPYRPRRTGWPHFGLQTMRERAEAIGGSFEVESVPGVGTKVIVRIPLATRPEVRGASPAR